MIRILSILLSSSIGVSLGLSLSTTTLADEETTRGLKSRIPVKPYFEEPRFRENRPEPLGISKVLPAPPSLDASHGLGAAQRFKLDAVVIEGNSVLSEERIDVLVGEYKGLLVSIDDLQSLRQKLSLAYFKQGYVNSGVVIPDQNVDDGVVKFQVIEGRLSSIDLKGNDGLFDSYIRARIELGVDTPLNVNDLQSALRRLQQNRLIKKVNAQLNPGAKLGEAELEVDVEEAESKHLTISADNYRSPNVGAEQGSITYTDNNFIGYGDTLSLSYSGTEGLDAGSFNYLAPITAAGSSLYLFYNFSDSQVVEEPFDQLNIESESSNYGFTFSSPLYQSNGTELTASTGLTLKDSDSFLSGEPFDFSLGSIGGNTKTTVAELGIEYVERQAAQVYALGVTWRKGLDALDSNTSTDPNTPDSEFDAFLGQAQYARRFEFLPAGQLIARMAFQMSLDPLLSIEKFALGGHSSVRGYRENQLVRDNGLNTSIELRIAPFIDDNGIDPYHFKIAPFFDWGSAWNEEVAGNKEETLDIYSAGLGVLWQPVKGLNTSLYWGEALEDKVKSDNGDDVQDDGLHLSASYTYSF